MRSVLPTHLDTRVLTQLWEFYAVNSIQRENYSISRSFYLFCFLLFLSPTGNCQEVLWSQPGLGARPKLTFLGERTKEELVLLSSPFGNQLAAFAVNSGQSAWSQTFVERFPFSTLPLNEAVVVQGDQGTIWALKNDTGDPLWQIRDKQPLDYPISPPRFRNSAVFTLSRRGRARKIDERGVEVAKTRQNNAWGERIARTVPLRSSQQQLSFLDQSGRLVTYDPETLKHTSVQLSPPNQSTSRPGKTREVLAGALDQKGETIWTVELRGVLQATSLPEGQPLWRVRLSETPELWSRDSRLLASPTPVSWLGRIALMVVTQNNFTVYDGSNGEIMHETQLPSPAVAPPTYDRKTEVWWILCEKHLIALEAEGQPRILALPIVEKPFTMRVLNGVAVIGTLNGRVFGILLGPQEAKTDRS
jgi:outer membrane protein assembly factor BamB